MNKVGMMCLAAAVALLGGCDIDDPYQNVDNTRYVATDEFEYETPVEGRHALDLNAINGKVEVIAIPGAQTVRIWGEKRVASDSDEDANEHLDNLEVRMIADDERISVRTAQPENTHGRDYRVDYSVRIPAGWAAVIIMVNGAAYLDNLSGDTSIELVNGEVVLRSIYGSLETRVTNGDVDARMVLAPGGRCDLSTVNGRIDLMVPRITSAGVTAGLTTGSISVSNLELHEAVRTKRTLKGVLGDGNGEILLQTVNGSIALNGE